MHIYSCHITNLNFAFWNILDISKRISIHNLVESVYVEPEDKESQHWAKAPIIAEKHPQVFLFKR